MSNSPHPKAEVFCNIPTTLAIKEKVDWIQARMPICERSIFESAVNHIYERMKLHEQDLLSLDMMLELITRADLGGTEGDTN